MAIGMETKLIKFYLLGILDQEEVLLSSFTRWMPL